MTDTARKPRIRGEERAALAQKMRRDYEAGDSVRDLAAVYKRSYGFCYRLLHEAGTQMRARKTNAS